MDMPVGERAVESSQPCRKGSVHGRIKALEGSYEEYRISSMNNPENRSGFSGDVSVSMEFRQ